MYCSQDMEFGRDRCERVFSNPICNASLAFADGQEARLVTSQNGRSVNNHLLFLLIKKVIQSEFPALGKVISMAAFSFNLSCNVVALQVQQHCCVLLPALQFAEMLQKVEHLTTSYRMLLTLATQVVICTTFLQQCCGTSGKRMLSLFPCNFALSCRCCLKGIFGVGVS